MKLKVLGSSGAEFGRYNLPAFLVDRCLLLDAGTIGMAVKEVEQWKIRCILITHAHFDHIKGIPFFAENLHMRHKRHGVTIMSIPHVLKALQNNLFNNILWPDFTKIPDVKNPVLKLRKIAPKDPFYACGHKVTAFKVNHSVPAVGYIIEDVKGKRLLYTGDTSPTNSIWRAAGRIDCVIVEVSFPNRMEAFAIRSGHLTPKLTVRELQKMENLPGKVLITHQKPLYLKQIYREIEALRMKNVRVVEDGKTYEI
jgi:ribonuclease BN (tRNA processing enzyme)